MNLSAHLEPVTEAFWQIWRDWRYELGWRLGPDMPAAKMSPHLVDSWSMLTEESRLWFRQHTALVLHAIEQKVPKVEPSLAPAQVIEVGELPVAEARAFFKALQAAPEPKPQQVKERPARTPADAMARLERALKAIEAKDAEMAGKAYSGALRCLGDAPAFEKVRSSIQVAKKNLDMLVRTGEAKRSVTSTRSAMSKLQALLAVENAA